MNFPLIPLPGFLSSWAQTHFNLAVVLTILGVPVGMAILICNASSAKKSGEYEKESARVGYCCLGVALVAAIFGAYIFITAIVVLVAYLVFYLIFWRVFVKNAIAALSPEQEKRGDIGPGPD